jgi:small subunit ribosomal protein S5
MDNKSKRPFKRRRRKDREFDQVLVDVARVARVMKGGRRFGFRATIVIGDRKSKVAVGIARGADVTSAINKAVAKAKKNFVLVPLINGTIPHEITVKFGSAQVFLKPAPPGTGIIAGGGVRAVAEMGGIKDLLSKTQGSASKINNVKATLLAFERIKTPQKIAKQRGIELSKIMPKRFQQPAAKTIVKPQPAAKNDSGQKPSHPEKVSAVPKK